jgi:hypothetical protein
MRLGSPAILHAQRPTAGTVTDVVVPDPRIHRRAGSTTRNPPMNTVRPDKGDAWRRLEWADGGPGCLTGALAS